MKVVLIQWRDHHSVYGWFSPEDVQTAGHINVSAGILVGQDEVHTTIAQTVHADLSVYADLLHIITKDITFYEELN